MNDTLIVLLMQQYLCIKISYYTLKNGQANSFNAQRIVISGKVLSLQQNTIISIGPKTAEYHMQVTTARPCHTAAAAASYLFSASRPKHRLNVMTSLFCRRAVADWSINHRGDCSHSNGATRPTTCDLDDRNIRIFSTRYSAITRIRSRQSGTESQRPARRRDMPTIIPPSAPRGLVFLK
jgi:hypothetical protein